MYKEKHGHVLESHHPEMTLVNILVYFQSLSLCVHFLCHIPTFSGNHTLGMFSTSCTTLLQLGFNGDVIYSASPISLDIDIVLFFS